VNQKHYYRRGDRSNSALSLHNTRSARQLQQQRRGSNSRRSYSVDEDYPYADNAAAAASKYSGRLEDEFAGKQLAGNRGVWRLTEDVLDPDFTVQFRKPRKFCKSAAPAGVQSAAAAATAAVAGEGAEAAKPATAAEEKQQQQQVQQQMPDTFMGMLADACVSGDAAAAAAAAAAAEASLEDMLLAELKAEMRLEQQQQHLRAHDTVVNAPTVDAAVPPQRLLLQQQQQLAAKCGDGGSSAFRGSRSPGSSGSNYGHFGLSPTPQQQQAAQLADAILASGSPASLQQAAASPQQQQQQQQQVRPCAAVPGASAATALDKEAMIEELMHGFFDVDTTGCGDPVLPVQTPAATTTPQHSTAYDDGFAAAWARTQQQRQQQQQQLSAACAAGLCNAAALPPALDRSYSCGIGCSCRLSRTGSSIPCTGSYNIYNNMLVTGGPAGGCAGMPRQLSLQSSAVQQQLTAALPGPQQQQQCDVGVSRRLTVQRMALLQQQMSAVSSQMKELQSMVAGFDAAAAVGAVSNGPMQMLIHQQQQQQQVRFGNAVLLPQLSSVSTLSSALQHPAWLL
jgi:hypothetical protein